MASTATRPPRSQSQTPRKDWLSEVKTKGPGLPSRVILHAVEKFGKTSFGAFGPKVIFGVPADETGLLTLIDAGRVPETPHLPPWATWVEVLESIEALRTEKHDYKTFAVDTLNGVEKLCHTHVCQREYGGDWGKRGFASYQQGYDVSLSDWREFLNALERLRTERRMSILCLCHTEISTFKNPEGLDFDRYVPAMHRKTWNVTHRWADVILFGNYYVDVEQEGTQRKGKGKGGQDRILYTVRHAAYDAGNRLGLPEEIEMGDSPKTAWDNFVNAMKEAKGGEQK